MSQPRATILQPRARHREKQRQPLGTPRNCSEGRPHNSLSFRVSRREDKGAALTSPTVLVSKLIPLKGNVNENKRPTASWCLDFEVGAPTGHWTGGSQSEVD